MKGVSNSPFEMGIHNLVFLSISCKLSQNRLGMFVSLLLIFSGWPLYMLTFSFLKLAIIMELDEKGIKQFCLICSSVCFYVVSK